MIATVISYPNNEINYSVDVPSSTNSEELVKLLFVNVNDTTIDSYIEITYNSRVITLLIKEEYKNTPAQIHFINKEGAQQCLTFFAERVDSLSVNGDIFERNGISVLNAEHQFKDFNKNSRSKFTVNSGYVDEDLNETFKQLLLSEFIWIYENNTFLPITIDSKELEYLTRNRNKLIKYTLSFSYSFNDINTI